MAIQLVANTKGHGIITVVAVDGRTVYRKTLQLEKGTVRLDIPIADWPSGWYGLQFEAGDQLHHQRFLKR